MLNIVSIKRTKAFSIKDVVSILILFAIFSVIRINDQQMHVLIVNQEAISLDWHNLPDYSMRTVMRMLIAVIFSFLFTIIYATLAAKSSRLEKILIPILDILQSIPILGYLSFIITFCLALFPGSIMGVEVAAIFAIFTSQVWNMTFSYYQSLKTIPKDLEEAAAIMKLSPLHKFLQLELPFAVPGLLWNTMISMSCGWFFVVASEAITVGNTQYQLPGIGSYIAVAIANKNIHAVIYAIISMTIVILIYDQLLFRPIVAWSEKFKCENLSSGSKPQSWVLDLFSKTSVVRVTSLILSAISKGLIKLSYKIMVFNKSHIFISQNTKKRMQDVIWYSMLLVICAYGAINLAVYVKQNVTYSELFKVFYLSVFTAIRVFTLIILAAIFWIPVGVYIGLRPRLTEFAQPIIQFLSAFPVNLLFPIVVIGISHYHLNPNIWLSPLMVMGTQWYILFNVIAGVSSFPTDLKEAYSMLSIKGFLWWRKIMLPAIFPFVVTGSIAASGGAWNASIVSEIVSWGNTTLVADGIGSYITQATTAGDYNKIALGIAMLSFFVVVFNRFLWRPLYKRAEERIKTE